MAKFIGRQVELKRLYEVAEKKTASFLIIKGRRRVGKSRLVEEFGKSFDRYYCFSGLPPKEDTTVQMELDEFSRQMAKNFGGPVAKYGDWGDALWAVAEKVTSGKTLLLFDEISWMGSQDSTFLGKIKNFWDLHLKKNDKLIFIVCGSASSWIEKNIMTSTGFVGRISLTLTLEDLSLKECNEFWPKNISAYEKIKFLSVTGGIPKYLEEMNSKISAEENIKRLCFTKGGFLVDEFERIFSNTFLRDSSMYKNILYVLAEGTKEQGEIQKGLNLATPGRLAEYLWELELAGFVTRDYTLKIKTGEDSKLSQYRLRDNYIRFYLKYIEKNLGKINRNGFAFKSLSLLPGWDSILGFQFENIVLNNRRSIYQALGVKEDEVISENPYFQRKTARKKGCQIDYIIQTKFDTLYICEIKFSKNKVGISVVEEVQCKIDTLDYSQRFSCRPVLIHINGVDQDVVDSDYFARIIDVSEFLN